LSGISSGISRCYPSQTPIRFAKETDMAQVYFHCSNSREVRVDRYGAAVSNLAEARDRAACMVRSLIMEKSAEDWRDWVVHVSDDFDDEIFEMPFASVLGKPN
jgi:hypothetical protein